jgi:hypothetical protein
MFVLLYLVDTDLYDQVLDEDGPTEWLTFLCLMTSTVLAGRIAHRLKGKGDARRWFFIAFCVGSLLAGLEEISWEQRLIGIESPEFFMERSDQEEINIHNVLQLTLHVETKHIAGIVLALYGVALPLLVRRVPRIASLCSRFGLVVPPSPMMASWLLAGLMMIDEPSGYEEEIGEFLFSVCFVLLMATHLSEVETRDPGGA